MEPSTRYRFAGFELDVNSQVLLKGREPVPIGRQAFRALTLLVSRAGELVTRQEFQNEIWGDRVHVDFERGLNECIRQVRATLGDDIKDHRIIITHPRVGYRLAVPVHRGIEGGWWSVQRWAATAAAIALIAAGYLAAPSIIGGLKALPGGFGADSSGRAPESFDILSDTPLPLPVSSVQVTPTRGAEAQPLLALKDARSYQEDAFYIVEGEVVSLSDESLRDVSVVTTWYAKDGTVFVRDDAPMHQNPIRPGQASRFKTVTSTNPAMSRFSVSFHDPVEGLIKTRDDRSTLVSSEAAPWHEAN